MSKPIILAVDDDSLVSAAIVRLAQPVRRGIRHRRRELRAEALALLARVALRDQPVALIVADQRMPAMSGIDLLERARNDVADSKTLLLKPRDPPEERLYPVIDDLLDDWRRAHPDVTSVLRVIGHRWSERGHEIKSFLARNYVPYRWYDVECDEEGRRLLALSGWRRSDRPGRLVMLGHKIRGGRVTVVRDFSPDLPRIDAYAGELNQVWTNLIDNAVDAMNGEGTLRVGAHADGDEILVEIADTGPGMPPEVAARAFEAFYTTKEVGKGSGLGLDIARRIVEERHGGTISIDTHPGGTVLRVRIPADLGSTKRID